MSVTSGFFNSVKSDRKYNSEEMSEIFDGIISDGVYSTIYNQFAVRENDGMTIQVDTGRAWFDHCWIKNDNILLLEIDPSEILFDRIDAVVLDVDHTDPVRDGNIKIIKGTPSNDPKPPTLIKEERHKQYPIDYIRVSVGSTSITQADITNMVGTSECPIVTGVVEVMSIDFLVSQWQAQWNNKIADQEKTWNTWYKTHTSQYNYDFNDWFSQLQALLDGDIAANMANEIYKIKNDIRTLVMDKIYIEPLTDNNAESILDSEGREIDSIITFKCCCGESKEVL